MQNKKCNPKKASDQNLNFNPYVYFEKAKLFTQKSTLGLW